MNVFLICLSVFCGQVQHTVFPGSSHISYMGRFNMSDTAEYICSYPASTISVRTNSRNISAYLTDYAHDSLQTNYVEIIVDDSVYKTIQLNPHIPDTIYDIAAFDERRFRTISIVKRTEGHIGNIGFSGFVCEANSEFEPVVTPKLSLLYIGNSITCGYGNEAVHADEEFSARTENAYMSYAAIAARILEASYHLIAYSGKGIYRNWADTVFKQDCMPEIFNRTYALKPSPQWNHAAYVPDVIIINLGTNDFSPPLGADKTTFVSEYIQFLQDLMQHYHAVPIVLISSQMLGGDERKKQILWLHEIQSKMASDLVSVCELSQQGDVGFGADWHPNRAQNKINSAELVNFLQNNILSVK
ncbi:MAG: GDSL-type esterase/lipase family protein [Bacteroidales bacterium]